MPSPLDTTLHLPAYRPAEAAAPRGASRRGLVLPALAAILLLAAADPTAWGAGPALWAPAAGLGLVLIAWFGPRAGWLVLAAGLLAAGQIVLTGALFSGRPDWGLAAFTAGGALLNAAELLAAWWLFRRAGGARALADPRSAVVFILTAPGLAAALFAAARAALAAALLGGWDALGPAAVVWWLSRALGLLTVAPPLLTAATPWLVRRGWVRPEALAGPAGADCGPAGADRLTRGDAIEIAGLALGAGLLALVLACTYARAGLLGWQPWGAPLLLIVWASLRQGQRGGVLAAGVAAALPLCFLAPLAGASPAFLPLIQGNLLALVGAGLLAAAAAGWVRVTEMRYRQVVAHVPVVVYSGRLAPTAGARGEADAEITLVSDASGALLGCPPEQLLGDHRLWLERVHPDDREVVRAALAQLGRQRQPVVCEYRLAPPAGAPTRKGATPLPPRWLRDVLAPRLDAEGRPVGWEGVVTDVTEQRALSVDLRRTTGMFHALVSNLPAGVYFVQGPGGHPVLVNNRARELLGRREDAAAGLEHLARAHHLFRPDGSPYPVEELPVYQSLRRGVKAMADDVVVHRPDGRRVPLVTWAAPVRLEGSGQADAAVWVLEDLTALHQAEAARRDSEGRLRAVVETMAEALVVQDRNGRIVDCNAAACALFGRMPEQLRGATLFAAWSYLREDGAPLPEADHPAAAVRRTGRPVRNVVLGLTRQAAAPAEVRWLLVNAMPLGAGPAAAGAVTTFSDLTAYRRAQEFVRQSEEKYRGLVESMPLVLFQSDRQMRVEYANPAATAATGYTAEEVVDPAVWGRLVHPDDMERVSAAAGAALEGRQGRLEFRHFTKDGSMRTSFAIIQPRWQDGGVIGATTLMVDVTRERQLEQDLQRSQRLELIGRLSSGVAHDFNNLLTVVLGLAELAHSGLPPEHPVHHDLHRISEAGRQAASLAGQLLSFGRQPKAPSRPADVNRVVRRTLDLLRTALPKEVAVEADLAGGAPAAAAVDETQLQQVLMNLCLNARDAMPTGGRLRVATATVAHPGEPAAPWVRLTVADDGCGMPDEVQARIFDPFFSTKERGTGLGLAVVRQIVECGGGRVEVHSEPGRGSRFEVWLPTRPPANPVATADAFVGNGI